MDSFRLDRNVFKGQTAEEAANHKKIYQGLSWQDRLKIAAYLNSIAFRYDPENPPRMDRTRFAAKSRQ